MRMSDCTIVPGDCLKLFSEGKVAEKIAVTFLDPPFNQDKEYTSCDDNLPDEEYWKFMRDVCRRTYEQTQEGGAMYFMQREKNTEAVLRVLRESGWVFQNLIVWKKKTSAVPGLHRFGKHYQIIAFATKGDKPRIFHRLRITPPLPANYKFERESGMYVTDVWDDIRELTSGYFSGDEALRKKNGERVHKQQSPVALLLRIILSSSEPGDAIFDPFAGSGTTLTVARQLGRKAVGIELDDGNISCIKERLSHLRAADDISRLYDDYLHTENIAEIWGKTGKVVSFFSRKPRELKLF